MLAVTRRQRTSTPTRKPPSLIITSTPLLNGGWLWRIRSFGSPADYKRDKVAPRKLVKHTYTAVEENYGIGRLFIKLRGEDHVVMRTLNTQA